MLPQHILRAITLAGEQALGDDSMSRELPSQAQPKFGAQAHINTVVPTGRSVMPTCPYQEMENRQEKLDVLHWLG